MRKSISAVSIVESPLQLLCAIEAINYFKVANPIYYVRLSSQGRNDEQILNVIELLNLRKNVRFVEVSVLKQRNMGSISRILLSALKIILSGRHADYVLLGSYDSKFIKFFKPFINKRKIKYVDDGAKTLILLGKESNKRTLDFYTFYNIPNTCGLKIYHNDFSYLKGLISAYPVELRTIFLGAPLYEDGFLDFDENINLFKKIFQYYGEKTILYVSHRREDKGKLAAIEAINPNIETVCLDYPIELYGLYEKKTPLKIASFHSTALITMRNIYGANAIAFRFQCLNSKKNAQLEQVFSFYSLEIKVLDMRNQSLVTKPI